MRRWGVALLCLSLCACTIGRDYIGNELRAVPGEVLKPGATTLGEVLQTFGAPDRIQRRRNGEILTYRFVRGNESTLTLEEPVITGVTFFIYTKKQVKANRLTLFFDDAGVLETFGYTTGTEELEAL
ncbi:MAG: hypothetical protein AAF430_07880 [Myxococcota bacterium]